MNQQQLEVDAMILSMAEEQVLFLKNRYKMDPSEIVCLYTGERQGGATYGDAIESIVRFNSQSARTRGFIAS